MSEPVSNSEVEDVLASIRRLVTDDDRPKRTVTRPAADAGAEGDSADHTLADRADTPASEDHRLVLTPALRVGEAEAETSADAPDGDSDASDSDSFDFTAAGVAAFVPRARSDAEPEDDAADHQAAEPQDDAPEAQMAVDVPQDTQDAPGSPGVMNLAQFKLPDGDAAALAETEGADEPSELGDPGDDVDASDMSATGDIDAPRFDSVRGDVPDEDALAEDKTEEMAAADPVQNADTAVEADGLDAEDVADASADATQTPDVSDDEAPVTALSLGEKIAALEDVISRRRENWEPDGSEDGPAPDADLRAAAEPVFQHHAKSDRVEAVDAAAPADHPDEPGGDSVGVADEPALDDVPQQTVPDAAQAADDVGHDVAEPVFVSAQPDAADLNDADLLDEEALRDLVAEIVRQELQGELGERITRNVRKLVRREIHRALTAKDLE